jgi:FkbM family methyltransferase
MPASATLPLFQKMFPLYDKFLPVLANNLNSKEIVIDVGANVGDTLIAMIQHCENLFICVEPSDFFFKYLKKNTLNLNPKDAKRVELRQNLVGTGKFLGKLNEDGATAHVVYDCKQNLTGGVNPNTVKLDDLVMHHDNIILLKSDVDGFDFDVIRSANKILTESEPILFFENDIAQKFQQEEFDKLYDFLQEKNYRHVYIFDNFGNIIVQKSDYHTLKNLNEYLFSMVNYNMTRTFYYTDVLVATDKRVAVVENAVADYKKCYLNK